MISFSLLAEFESKRAQLIGSELINLETLVNQLAQRNKTTQDMTLTLNNESLQRFLVEQKRMAENHDFELLSINQISMHFEHIKQVLTSLALANNEMNRGHKFSKQASLLLKRWFYRNYSHPYPSSDEVQKLANLCNLSCRQIQIWFINARGRIIKKSYNQSKFKNIVKQRYLMLSQRKDN